MNPAQLARLAEIARRFGCWPADVRFQTHPFDLPDGYVLCVVGEDKGRPFTFGISPEGVASS